MGIFSKKSPTPPPPPNVIQYPNVLTPPQNGGLDTIESYQYSQVVELLSDGPIEGIVNKNGVIVNGSNLFEGVYFNETPVKETSSLSYECFDFFSKHLSSSLNRILEYKISTCLSFGGLSNIVDNFSISTTSSSNLEFEKKIEWYSNPLSSCYDLFLACICIPNGISFYLYGKNIDLDIFDVQKQQNLIEISMYDLSSEMYPKICSDNFNDFTYFEMPKSCICHGGVVKNTSNSIKIMPSSNGYVTFSIWGISEARGSDFYPVYNCEIINKYLNVFVYQNKNSLYNFNSVSFEFKNGSQFQKPIESIDNIEIEYFINKPLYGPVNNLNSVQRLKSFCADSLHRPLTNIELEKEGSRDDRYVKSWPVEYDCQNSPYLICNLVMSYSHYDETTRNRAEQKAYPYTHYVLNQNAECVYISIGLTQLSDTAHVDLAAVDTVGLNTTKYKNTELPPAGTKNYSQLDVLGKATYWRKNVNPGTQGNPGSLGGNLEPESFDFKNQQQSISVGTKLPTIVSFKVETGYETDMDGNKNLTMKNSMNFYSYKYDIFGLVQTPNTNLEFGRTDLRYNNYVYASRSNWYYNPSRAHRSPYVAYETITNKYTNIYDTAERSVWYSVRYIKSASARDYFNKIIARDYATLQLLRQSTLVDLYADKDAEFTIGNKVYTDKLLSEPFGDGVILEQTSENYYAFYLVIGSIITNLGEWVGSIVDELGDTGIIEATKQFLKYEAKVKIDPAIADSYILNFTKIFDFFKKTDVAIAGISFDEQVKVGDLLYKAFYRPNIITPYNQDNKLELLVNKNFYTYYENSYFFGSQIFVRYENNYDSLGTFTGTTSIYRRQRFTKRQLFYVTTSVEGIVNTKTALINDSYTEWVNI